MISLNIACAALIALASSSALNVNEQAENSAVDNASASLIEKKEKSSNYGGTYYFDYGGADFASDSNYHLQTRSKRLGNFTADFTLNVDEVAFIYSVTFSRGIVEAYDFYIVTWDNADHNWLTNIFQYSPCAQYVNLYNFQHGVNIELYGYPYVTAEAGWFMSNVEQVTIDYNSPEGNRKTNYWIDDDDKTNTFNFFYWDFIKYFEDYYVGFANSIGYGEGYTKGEEDGYALGYETGKTEGDSIGYNRGYTAGQQSVTDATTAISTLFGAVASVPSSVLNGLGELTIWQVSIIAILITFLMIAIIVWIIKKFI